MKILAIDPGPVESAFLVLENGKPSREFGKVNTAELLAKLRLGEIEYNRIAIEMIASYGMAVGREIFETCTWIGRFEEAAGGAVNRVFRKDVKLHLCGNPRAKDSNIRQALIDRFGPPGTKRDPGATYGISKDVWSALAIAVTFFDGL